MCIRCGCTYYNHESDVSYDAALKLDSWSCVTCGRSHDAELHDLLTDEVLVKGLEAKAIYHALLDSAEQGLLRVG